MRHRGPLALAFVLVAASAGYACTIVDSLKVPDADAGSVAATDAGDAADAYVNPCRHTGFPDPPATPVGISGGSTYYLTIKTLDFGRVDGGTVAVGYNLDNECTCYGTPPDPQSCIAMTSSEKHCDDLGHGIDNAVAELVNGPALNGGYDIQGLSQRALAKGRNGMLLKLDQYNGGPDDSAVTLSFYASGGPVTAADGGGLGFTTPTFTDADSWSVDSNGLLQGTDGGVYISASQTPAYVTGGILVANNLNTSVRFDTGLFFDLRNATITGQIVIDQNGLRLDNATFTGRWATSDALRNLGNLTDPGAQDGGRVCNDPTNFGLLKSVMCAAADISSVGPDNASLPCDALSFGMHFAAVPAKFGPALAIDPGAGVCDGVVLDTSCSN